MHPILVTAFQLGMAKGAMKTAIEYIESGRPQDARLSLETALHALERLSASATPPILEKGKE